MKWAVIIRERDRFGRPAALDSTEVYSDESLARSTAKRYGAVCADKYVTLRPVGKIIPMEARRRAREIGA